MFFRKKKQIFEITAKIQDQINQLYLAEPNDETFDQEGILNGSQIIQEYLEVNEYGIAIEHLLYMFYESEIEKSMETIEQLNELTENYKIKNPYL